MKEIKYTVTHEWIETGKNEVRMGITEHAQHLLGDIVFVDFPNIDLLCKTKDELGVIESVKAAADYYAPVSGVVLEINEKLRNNPALLNTDPENTGWLVKLKVTDMEQFNLLLNQEEYQKLIAEES